MLCFLLLGIYLYTFCISQQKIFFKKIPLTYKQLSPDSVNHLKLEALQKVYRNWSKRQHFISVNVFSFLRQKIKLVDSKWAVLANVNHHYKVL